MSFVGKGDGRETDVRDNITRSARKEEDAGKSSISRKTGKRNGSKGARATSAEQQGRRTAAREGKTTTT